MQETCESPKQPVNDVRNRALLDSVYGLNYTLALLNLDHAHPQRHRAVNRKPLGFPTLLLYTLSPL